MWRRRSHRVKRAEVSSHELHHEMTPDIGYLESVHDANNDPFRSNVALVILCESEGLSLSRFRLSQFAVSL
jgi:hypothetical protein